MRRAFTLLELLVVVAVLGVFAGAAWGLMRGGVRGLTISGEHQVALRNALILTTGLAQDFRAIAVLNERREYQSPYPVAPQSIVLSPARTSVRMRVSTPIESLDADPSSRFTIVTWQLCMRDGPGTFTMRREERTASARPLPGERTDRRSHTFEDLPLSGMRLHFVAWLGPLEWRQFVTLSLTAGEGQVGDAPSRDHRIIRQFDVGVPPPPHGSAGGPRGFALDFPPSALAGQLSGGVDIVGRPGNTDALEAPPDAVDRNGTPFALPPELPVGPVADPFARVEIKAGPLRSQFLQTALDRLEAAVGAGYRGALCGAVDDARFRLDASEASTKPVIVQLDELIDRLRPKGPAALVQLLYRMQLETFPGSDKPVLEAARLLLDEPRGFKN